MGSELTDLSLRSASSATSPSTWLCGTCGRLVSGPCRRGGCWSRLARGAHCSCLILSGSKTRKIPYPPEPFTWLFLLVSCPNYTYEVRVCAGLGVPWGG